MKRYLVPLVFLLFISGIFLAECVFQPVKMTHVPDPVTERTVESGRVVGFIEENGSHAWLGIPYASAPTGALRWKGPRPAQKWNGTLETVEPGSVCPQYGGLMSESSILDYNDPVGEEDCLFLNVWAPAFRPDEIPSGGKGLPVMVWIHGGGNSVGHGGSFTGRVLAKKYNVIVITLNYRLGPLGWFSHPALREEGETSEDKSGNYGTLDIIQSLKWVRSNISGFGGNPGNVTIFGESAGGKDVFSLLLSPSAKGLFHRAISESGAYYTTKKSKAENYSDDPEKGHRNSSREIINKLLVADGIASGRKQAVKYQDGMSSKQISEYLRNKTAAELVGVYEPGSFGMISLPEVLRDGAVIPDRDPIDVFKNKAAYNAVPLILGTNRDEYKIFMAMDSEYVNLLGVKDPEYYDIIAGYLSDEWKANGADEPAAIMRASQGPSVYVYRFDWDEEPSFLGRDLSKSIGAGHAIEIPFVFNQFEVIYPGFSLFFSDDNLPGRTSLSGSISSYWAEFAFSGAPGKGKAGTEIEWKAWNNTPGADKYIIFDTPQDRGIRMSAEAVRIADLKKRLLTERSIKSQAKLCEIYVRLFGENAGWNDDEYKNLGEEGCGEYPKEKFE